MKILVWTGHHDPLDAAIKMFTHGRGSHAAFLRADHKTVHEAFYPRVRDRALTTQDIQNVEIFELEGVTPQEHQAFERWFDSNLPEKGGKLIEYSIGDLFRFAVNLPSKNERHTYCSRYVMHGCQTVLPKRKWPLVRLEAKDWASPRDIRISPRMLDYHWKLARPFQQN